MHKQIAVIFVVAVALGAAQPAQAQYMKPATGTMGSVPAAKSYAPPTFGAAPATTYRAPPSRPAFASEATIGGPKPQAFKPYRGYSVEGAPGARRMPGQVDLYGNKKSQHPFAD